MGDTTIEWTDQTWNPVRGCTMVSAGCEHCYAMKQAHRFSGKCQPYAGLTELGPQGPRWTGTIRLVPEVLDAPLRWTKPRRIFVNSMSDLFHQDVQDEFIDRIWNVMALRPQHTFQVLTKRPQRMLAYVRDAQRLPNVWLGVSMENQQTADERIPILLQTPAAVRWISAEPLLGPIHLEPFLLGVCKDCGSPRADCQQWRRSGKLACCPDCRHLERLDWVVVGGESGPGARPCHIGWIRSIVQQCHEEGVPCFVKQLGAVSYVERELTGWPAETFFNDALNGLPGYDAKLTDKKGGDPWEWPVDLRVREWPRYGQT